MVALALPLLEPRVRHALGTDDLRGSMARLVPYLTDLYRHGFIESVPYEREAPAPQSDPGSQHDPPGSSSPGPAARPRTKAHHDTRHPHGPLGGRHQHLQPHQALRLRPGSRRFEPRRGIRRGSWLSRPKRSRQIHDDPGAARYPAPRFGPRAPARRRPVARRRAAAPQARICARRRGALAEPHRRRGHRPVRTSARRRRHEEAR